MPAKKKTVIRIRESLVKLLETTPLDEITVTAICETANVNRATFYYHYDSVQDLFKELERQLEVEFGQSMSLAAIGNDGTPNKDFYVMFFEFVARNAAVCKMLLNSPHSDNSSFFTRAIAGGRLKVVGTMSRLFPECPAGKIEYYYIFVSHGFLGLLEHWLNNGMRESVKDIAEIGERISYSGVRYLQS